MKCYLSLFKLSKVNILFYGLDETLKQFENSQPRFVITESTQVSKMLKVAEKIPSIKVIVLFNACGSKFRELELVFQHIKAELCLS